MDRSEAYGIALQLQETIVGKRFFSKGDKVIYTVLSIKVSLDFSNRKGYSVTIVFTDPLVTSTNFYPVDYERFKTDFTLFEMEK